MNRVQFILKHRSYTYPGNVSSSGLYQSAKFCADALASAGIPVELVVVRDNNDIDREVTRFKPTHVIIEALWVVPEKFEILHKKHPHVRWIVRIHSEIPFIAGESVAMDWLLHYIQMPRVSISCNSTRMNDTVQLLAAKVLKSDVLARNRVVYLPNCYDEDFADDQEYTWHDRWINVGCFGAVRPMKNHLQQAIAAIQFADNLGRPLRLHINNSRTEQGGVASLKNVQGLFAQLPVRHYSLVEHPWHERQEFLYELRYIDIGMQVSFSETFNITTADMVSQNVPVVTSPEVSWVFPMFHADPTSVDDIVAKLHRAWRLGKVGAFLNRFRLFSFVTAGAKIWIKHFSYGPQG